ncbi:hypothetical protein Chor_002005 [Crotalus horridus]
MAESERQPEASEETQPLPPSRKFIIPKKEINMVPDMAKYLEVMRKLQKTYRMEPAGSQGVWGLDDFQFLPFIWGSSQLIVNLLQGFTSSPSEKILFLDHPNLEPRHFVDEKVVWREEEEEEMKTGPFPEHSNQLWNISAVPSWSKVNQGLVRMYKAECLEKFPVIQHFKFGSLLPIQPVAP